MGYFSDKDIDLNWYEKDDIEDMLEQYPELIDSSDEEIDKKIRELAWEAQGLYEASVRVENLVDAMRKFKEIR